MSTLLKKYPDTSLKDMAIFWLARAYYKSGNQQQAAKYMAQFLREYPENPLKNTVEEELVTLAHRYEKGEPLQAQEKKVQKAPAAHAGTASRTAQSADAERAAAAAAAERVAAARKAASRKSPVARREKALRAGASSTAMRNKAIAAYQAVIDRYPGTAAASSASAKLRELGIEYPVLAKSSAPAAERGEVAQVFNLEVAQYADVEVSLGPAPDSHEAGKPFLVPVDIVNSGNGEDGFHLESGFPPEYSLHFASASAPDVPISSTPTLAVGEKFRAVAVGIMPRSNIDGQRSSYPIKVVSTSSREVSQSKEIVLVTSAPLLRAVLKSDKAKLLPGEKISYRISLLNIGTAPGRGVTLRVNYPPQYEPVDFTAAGFKQEARGALVLDSLQLKSGESRDYNLAFQLKDEALAEQELFLRADVINGALDKKESFVSATTLVEKVSGVTARTKGEKLVVIPGQVVAVPLTIVNTGNLREQFNIKADVADNATYTFFADLNRDGNRQATEPIINHVGPLSPKEEAYVVLEVATPASASDGAVTPVSVLLEPEQPAGPSAAVNLQLVFSRPVLELSMAARGGRVKPGEVSSLELNCVNRGSNLAKQVTLQSILPTQLELVAADPSFSKADNGVYTWRFDELGAGESRNIRVTYRVKPGVAVGTSMQLKNLLNYRDPLGNRY